MKHGTTGYRYGCRCDTCEAGMAYRKAYDATYNRAYYREHRRRMEGWHPRVDTLGTTRRVQALMRMGWSQDAIAAECGWASGGSVLRTIMRRPTIRKATADAVAAAYNRLSMTPGPSTSTALRATRAGHAPPLAWDDDTIDEPKAKPNYGTGRSVSAVESTLELLEQGLSREGIAARLGVTRSAVDVYVSRANRSALGIESASDSVPLSRAARRDVDRTSSSEEKVA